MPFYQSQYQPRRQTTVMGKIADVERYDRFYDIAYDALRLGRFPQLVLPAGRLVVRAMKGPYDARGIPPSSSVSTENRFSGLRLDGRAGQGALYVGTIDGVLREHAHYSLVPKRTGLQSAAPPRMWKPGASDNTSTFIQSQKAGAPPPSATSKFYIFRVARSLRFADLRLTSLAPFMTQLRVTGEGAERYQIAKESPVDFQISAVGTAVDYSASRGIADAVFDQRASTGHAGVCALSSRADTDSGLVVGSDLDPTGGLVFAIFGQDSTTVSALVPPKDSAQASFNTYAELRKAIQDSSSSG